MVRGFLHRLRVPRPARPVPGSVFVSYRRADDNHAANRLVGELEVAFGRRCVFFDLNSIPAGDPFPQAIAEGIAAAAVVLVIVGKDWHEAKDKDGNRRLHDPNDFVRKEIELAAAGGKPIIPVVTHPAVELRLDDARLPESLRVIGPANARTLRAHGADFRTDVNRIVADVAGRGVRRSTALPRAAARHGRTAMAGAALLLAGGALYAVADRSNPVAAVPPPATPRATEPQPRLPLVAHLSADDRTALRAATERTVARVAAECDDPVIRQLYDTHKDDPKALLQAINQELAK